jgi:hypothetical protein
MADSQSNSLTRADDMMFLFPLKIKISRLIDFIRVKVLA